MNTSNDNNNPNEYPNSPFRGPGGEVSKENALSHYQWGDHCDGWNLVDGPSLSVKLERMPPFTTEQKHFHEHAQQFFFVLKGKAVFEIEDTRFTVKSNHGIHILPMQNHKIINETDTDLEFILFSQPPILHDRINCE
jgi:mannose-6-phosphate isomerase-like protein (cupin superfamily)